VDRAYKNFKTSTSDARASFPPRPNNPSDIAAAEIIHQACEAMNPWEFEEVGCAVSGILTPKSSAMKKKDAKFDWNMLISERDVTRKERFSPSDPIETIPGPVITENCEHICPSCNQRLTKRIITLLALVNGNWIGKIPPQLQNLSFAEELLIACVRSNYCVTRVSSGMHKLTANAILFLNP
ncbi:hypothetical protein K439DRAFT_1254234, partial [Ramaria rubella]